MNSIDLLIRATASIRGPGSLGTGFLVGEDLLLTCAHVLVDDDGRSLADEIVLSGVALEVDYANVHTFPELDLATIRLPTRLGCEIPVFDAAIELGDDVYAWGFSDEYPHGDTVTMEYEGPTKAARPRLKFKLGNVRPGFSGAPVVNRRTGGVCSILVTTRDRRSDAGARGIPLADVEIALSEAGIQRRGHLSLKERASSRLSFVRDDILSSPAPGSSRLKYKHLFTEGGLLLPFLAGEGPDVLKTRAVDPIPQLLSAGPGSESEDPRSCLILADGGLGKSTLAIALFMRLVDGFLGGGEVRLPLYVNLRKYRHLRASDTFGTSTWLSDLVGALTGTIPGHDEVQESERPASFLILDSLDEFLSGADSELMYQALERPLFREADVICCRSIFFSQFLAMTEWASRYGLFYLSPLTVPAVRDYARRYYAMFFPAEDAHWKRFNGRLEVSASFTSLCQIPLNLNMALEVLSPDSGSTDQSAPELLLALYHRYVEQVLRIEAAKVDSSLRASEKLDALERVAWHFYDEASLADSEAPPFTSEEFESLVAKMIYRQVGSASVSADLRMRSLLTETASPYEIVEPETMSFVHKSYHEYFVARHVYRSVCRDAEGALQAFLKYLSPEVSELLKEYFLLATDRPRVHARIGANLVKAVRLCRLRDDAGDERTRIAIGQLLYYVGTSLHPSAEGFLESELETESDMWLHRCIVLGLAYCKAEEHLHEYVDQLRAERTLGRGHTPMNDVNIGFHLTFFGDQPFSVLHPDVDEGLPNCARTIDRLCYQLTTATDRPSWRLNLYTIADLYRNRAASSSSAKQGISDHAHELMSSVARIRSDARCGWWPELDEVESACAEILEHLEFE